LPGKLLRGSRRASSKIEITTGNKVEKMGRIEAQIRAAGGVGKDEAFANCGKARPGSEFL
jgi:hypothetical protein